MIRLKIEQFLMVAVTAACLFATGCNLVPEYNILVNGYLDRDEAFEAGTPFHVLRSDDAANPLFEKELVNKVAEHLVNAGHQVVPLDEADFCVRFAYGTGARPQVKTEYYQDPFMPFSFYGRHCWHNGYWGYHHSPRIVNTVRTVHTHSLILQVIEAPPFRTDGTATPAWVGETSCSTSSPDIRAAMHYMLKALFHYFGEDTQIGRTVILKRTLDPEVELKD